MTTFFLFFRWYKDAIHLLKSFWHFKRIVKALSSWMFSIFPPFNFQIIACDKAPETLSQRLYGCIRYCWVGVKRFSISRIANNRKFTKLLTSWMFKESFSFPFIIDGFDMNGFTNLKQAWTYLHILKQCMSVSLKLT